LALRGLPAETAGPTQAKLAEAVGLSSMEFDLLGELHNGRLDYDPKRLGDPVRVRYSPASTLAPLRIRKAAPSLHASLVMQTALITTKILARSPAILRSAPPPFRSVGRAR
jgi:hypothetical protein